MSEKDAKNNDVIIQVKGLSKTFAGKDGEVEALKGIDLEIRRGEVFGVTGMSGAGKTTFVRCLNFLERPTEGEVIIDGKKLNDLSEKELRAERTQIAMIFQDFQLLPQRNALENVCFPPEIVGIKGDAAVTRARELLKEVGLAEKERSLPEELSGGQKQRVAIARALANNPKILLCDEATSALDPKTTDAILQLLKEINERYGITIVLITHAPEVVEKICDRVAVFEAGRVVKIRDVDGFFGG